MERDIVSESGWTVYFEESVDKCWNLQMSHSDNADAYRGCLQLNPRSFEEHNSDSMTSDASSPLQSSNIHHHSLSRNVSPQTGFFPQFDHCTSTNKKSSFQLSRMPSIPNACNVADDDQDTASSFHAAKEEDERACLEDLRCPKSNKKIHVKDV